MYATLRFCSEGSACLQIVTLGAALQKEKIPEQILKIDVQLKQFVYLVILDTCT